MNILLTATSYPPAIGGAQLHLHALARQLNEAHGLRVLCQWNTNRTDWLLGTTLQGPREEEEYVLDGVRVRRMTLSLAERRMAIPWVALYYVWQARAIAALAHPWTREILLNGPGMQLIHNTRIGREPISFASWGAAREAGVPFMLTPNHHPGWEGWFHRHYHRLYRVADGVLALTQAEKASLGRLGVDMDRITVTGVGPVLADSADPNAFRSEFGLAHRFVLFLGQKFRYKNLGVLLAATHRVWSTHPDVNFVFLGPRTAHSRRLFTGVVDPRVLEEDSVSLQVKTDALAACEMVCLPSSQESFGGVFVEAWMIGKPVIGCDIPAVREVIETGIDGIVAQPTSESLAEAILYILDHPAEARGMAARGREKALAHFTWEALAHKTEEAYGRALGH